LIGTSNARHPIYLVTNLSAQRLPDRAVKEIYRRRWGITVFPDAWAKAVSKSRLMHTAGIRATGRLMDRIMPPIDIDDEGALAEIEADLRKIAPICRWTSGMWEELEIKWNEVQSVPRHIHMLSNALIRAYARAQRSTNK
jgi:hypothetical protein